MRIGILGSGLMGAMLGTIFARAGHDVVFNHSQRCAGTPREATRPTERSAGKTL